MPKEVFCSVPGFAEGIRRLEHPENEDWALALPPSRENLWVVMPHGHGSDATQIFTRQDLRESWLPALRKQGLGLFCPNLFGNAWMNPPAMQTLKTWIEWLRVEKGAGRVILFSGSMGATGSLIYAAHHPEDVAGIAAYCPATDLPSYYQWCCEPGRVGVVSDIRRAIASAYETHPASLAQASAIKLFRSLIGIPFRLCHGSSDDIIPVQQSQRLAALLQDHPDFSYLEIPNGGHDCFCRDPSALEWVLSRLNARHPSSPP